MDDRQGDSTVVKEAAELSLKILSQILLGVELPNVLANSIRLVLDARAAATGKAVSAAGRRAVSKHGENVGALADLHRFLSELIGRRRKVDEDPGDLLGLLVRISQRELENGARQPIVDRRIRDEVVSMIIAHLDATAAALAWILREPHLELPPEEAALEPAVDVVMRPKTDTRRMTKRLRKPIRQLEM